MKRNLLGVGCLLIWLVGCSTAYDAKGIYHRVQRGETLLWIARSYGVDLQDIAELNNIRKEHQRLKPGEKLYIPPRRLYRHKKLPFEGKLSKHLREPEDRRQEWRKRLPKRDRKKQEVAAKKARKVYTDHSRFRWPVNGAVMSPFGIRGGRRHDGIDIRSKVGTPIRAADGGRVVYAGAMRGYGNLILLRHRDDFFTAYAHNRRNSVKKGQVVRRGETIGVVGRSGRATGPHLHFEVREGEKARNPLFFLPVVR